MLRKQDALSYRVRGAINRSSPHQKIYMIHSSRKAVFFITNRHALGDLRHQQVFQVDGEAS